MFILANKRFNIYASATIAGVLYPAGAMQDQALRNKLGITEIPDPVRGDDAYYLNQELDVAPWLQVTPRPLAELKQAAKRRINAECESRMAVVRQGYPDSEILSWPKQEADARQYIADPTGDYPILKSLATNRDITIGDLATRIIQKADDYAAISGRIIGTRQRLEDQIQALPANATVDAVRAIQWPAE